MPTIEKRISVSSHDAEIDGSLWQDTLDRLRMGQTLSVYHNYMHFAGLSIPQGATITAAYIRFVSKTAQSGLAVHLDIDGEAIDNASVYTSVSTWAARSKTSVVDWDDLPAWAIDEVVDTPSLVSIIQAIVDRLGWSSGNNMNISIEEAGSDYFAYREPRSYDGDSSKAPLLHVEWTVPYLIAWGPGISGDSIFRTTVNPFFPTSDGKLLVVYSEDAQKVFYRVSTDGGDTWGDATEIFDAGSPGSGGTPIEVGGVAVSNVFYGAIGVGFQDMQPFKITYNSGTETFSYSVGTAISHSHETNIDVVWDSDNSYFHVLDESGGGGCKLWAFNTSLVEQYTWDSGNQNGIVPYMTGDGGDKLYVIWHTTATGVLYFRVMTAGASSYTVGDSETGLPSPGPTADERMAILWSSEAGKIDIVWVSGASPTYISTRNAKDDWTDKEEIDGVAVLPTCGADDGPSGGRMVVFTNKMNVKTDIGWCFKAIEAGAWRTSASDIVDGVIKTMEVYTIAGESGLFYKGQVVCVHQIHTTDAVLQTIVAVAHTADAVLQATVAATHTADAILQAAVTAIHTTDAYLVGRVAETYTTDAILSAVVVVAHTADAYLVTRLVETHATDAVLKSAVTTAHAADAILQVTLTTAHTADAVLQATVTVVYTTDAILVASVARAHTADAILRATETLLHTADAHFVSRITAVHTADAILQVTVATTFTTDAVLQATQTAVHTTDAILGVVVSKAHTTDAVLKAAFTSVHTADAILRITVVETHGTDALVVSVVSQVHTTDAVLQSTVVLAHTTDAILQAAATETHSTDAILKAEQTAAHVTDAVLKATAVLTHTADAYLITVVVKTHDTDAVLRQTVMAVHTADAVLQATVEIIHTVDAILQTVQTIVYTTDATLKGTVTKVHTADAILLSTGAVPVIDIALVLFSGALTTILESATLSIKLFSGDVSLVKRRAAVPLILSSGRTVIAKESKNGN